MEDKKNENKIDAYELARIVDICRLTEREAIALYLMEPTSGTEWIDTMIHKANKRRAIISAALYNESRFIQNAGMTKRIANAFNELYPRQS